MRHCRLVGFILQAFSLGDRHLCSGVDLPMVSSSCVLSWMIFVNLTRDILQSVALKKEVKCRNFNVLHRFPCFD